MIMKAMQRERALKLKRSGASRDKVPLVDAVLEVELEPALLGVDDGDDDVVVDVGVVGSEMVVIVNCGLALPESPITARM